MRLFLLAAIFALCALPAQADTIALNRRVCVSSAQWVGTTVGDSLEQLRQLARQLEEQPESVVFGPRPPVKP